MFVCSAGNSSAQFLQDFFFVNSQCGCKQESLTDRNKGRSGKDICLASDPHGDTSDSNLCIFNGHIASYFNKHGQ